MSSGDYIRTLHPEYKDGVRMSTAVYDSIKLFILSILDAERQIPFSVFFQRIHLRFSDELGENTGWFAYHVKLDLEARGLLEQIHSKKKGDRESFIQRCEVEKPVKANKDSKRRIHERLIVDNADTDDRFQKFFKSRPLVVHSPFW